MSVPIKVAIVDDHTITREGIKELLIQDFSNRFHVVGDFSNGKEFLNFLKDNACDVVLMDIHMPVKSGDSTIEVLSKFHPEVSVVVLSMITMDYMIDKVMAAGAKAYLPKEADINEIKNALVTVNEKKLYFNHLVTEESMLEFKDRKKVSQELSTQERIVMNYLIEGLSNSEIADRLNISIGTVKKHKEHILKKTKCKRTMQLFHYALHMGLLDGQKDLNA